MKKRLDVLMVERGLAESRQRAQALILAKSVRVEGEAVTRSGASIDEERRIDVRRPDEEYVSRGAVKLLAALENFDVSVEGKIAIDIGASTGGFTDVLLRRGAHHVYAVDVGYGQLAWTIRQHERVTVMEKTNIRYLSSLPQQAGLATIDVSFISLELVIPTLAPLTRPDADVIALIKPQFEAGREQVGKGGVIGSPAVHGQVLLKVLQIAETSGWRQRGLIASPILGPAGNREFLVHLARVGDRMADVTSRIDEIVHADEGE